MGTDTFLEILNAHPVWYFVAGLLSGFMLRGMIAKVFASIFGRKKPGRYQNLKADAPVTRSATGMELHEPSFDLPDAVVKSLAPQRLSGIAFDQPSSEV